MSKGVPCSNSNCDEKVYDELKLNYYFLTLPFDPENNFPTQVFCCKDCLVEGIDGYDEWQGEYKNGVKVRGKQNTPWNLR